MPVPKIRPKLNGAGSLGFLKRPLPKNGGPEMNFPLMTPRIEFPVIASYA